MRIIFAFIFTFSAFSIFAQVTQGEIIFEEKINIHKSLPPEMEEFKAQMPEFRTSKKVLYFNDKEALYTSIPKTEEEIAADMGSRRRMRFGRGGMVRKIYYNFEEKSILDYQEFFGKKFLVEGGKTYNWKMTAEQKQVGSYLCQKVTFQDTSTNIVAWFTPMIRVSAGPAQYANLPGMILHVDINDGERMYTAMEINLKELEGGLIVRPKEGKKMTREEFDQMVEEKTAEMREQFGGNRAFRFTRRN